MLKNWHQTNELSELSGWKFINFNSTDSFILNSPESMYRPIRKDEDLDALARTLGIPEGVGIKHNLGFKFRSDCSYYSAKLLGVLRCDPVAYENYFEINGVHDFSQWIGTTLVINTKEKSWCSASTLPRQWRALVELFDPNKDRRYIAKYIPYIQNVLIIGKDLEFIAMYSKAEVSEIFRDPTTFYKRYCMAVGY